LADEQTNGAVPSRPAAPVSELRPELRPDIGYIARVVVLGTGKLGWLELRPTRSRLLQVNRASSHDHKWAVDVLQALSHDLGSKSRISRHGLLIKISQFAPPEPPRPKPLPKRQRGAAAAAGGVGVPSSRWTRLGEEAGTPEGARGHEAAASSATSSARARAVLALVSSWGEWAREWLGQPWVTHGVRAHAPLQEEGVEFIGALGGGRSSMPSSFDSSFEGLGPVEWPPLPSSRSLADAREAHGLVEEDEAAADVDAGVSLQDLERGRLAGWATAQPAASCRSPGGPITGTGAGTGTRAGIGTWAGTAVGSRAAAAVAPRVDTGGSSGDDEDEGPEAGEGVADNDVAASGLGRRARPSEWSPSRLWTQPSYHSPPRSSPNTKHSPPRSSSNTKLSPPRASPHTKWGWGASSPVPSSAQSPSSKKDALADELADLALLKPGSGSSDDDESLIPLDVLVQSLESRRPPG